ncbi:MAG: hypothetical protein Q8K75_00955 [Chlamydiales bacterium]|nr:hypothetical protein [Chlamydiales bacterium]
MADSTDLIDDVIATDSISEIADPTDMSIEEITQLLILSKLDNLKTEFAQKGQELKTRQDKVRWLHDLMQKLNKRIDKETGELDLTHVKIDETTGLLKEGQTIDGDEELKAILELRSKLKEAANEKGYEVKAQGKYNKDERERMLDNLRMICDDLNLQNDMQLQDLNQLINERYEVYQMARAILKPLHDDKLHKARSISGR